MSAIAASPAPLHRYRPAVVWFTGLSGSGKSTLANALARVLRQAKCPVYVIDGDTMRRGLCKDLGYSVADRHENIRRIGEVARLFLDAGMIVLAAAISPMAQDRRRARSLVAAGDFLEIYCHSPLAVCEARDVKGLYRRARQGEISDFTGISSPYEEPVNPELTLDTAGTSIDACVASLLMLLQAHGILKTDKIPCTTLPTT